MQMLLLSFGAWSGLYGAVSAPRPACFLPKTSPLCRFAPRGETPRRFSPHPFCGAGAKDKRLYRFLIRAACVRQPPQCCGDRRPRGLNARVHSVFCFSRREKKTSLAPCALAGYPLATTVCGQTPLVVVTNRPANWRDWLYFLAHYRVPITKPPQPVQAVVCLRLQTCGQKEPITSQYG